MYWCFISSINMKNAKEIKKNLQPFIMKAFEQDSTRQISKKKKNIIMIVMSSIVWISVPKRVTY